MATQELGHRYIVDLDGTLYKYRNTKGEEVGTFGESTIGHEIRIRTYQFLEETLQLSEADAITELKRMYATYEGEISVALEQEYNINRYTYFNKVWDIHPADFIISPGNVRESINVLQGRMALLTAAPKIWVVRALSHLQVEDLFNILHTGEEDLKKPDPKVFRKLVETLGVLPTMAVSMGDNNVADILPAKQEKMGTILVGPHIGDADERIDTIHQLVPTLQRRNWM